MRAEHRWDDPKGGLSGCARRHAGGLEEFRATLLANHDAVAALMRRSRSTQTNEPARFARVDLRLAQSSSLQCPQFLTCSMKKGHATKAIVVATTAKATAKFHSPTYINPAAG